MKVSLKRWSLHYGSAHEAVLVHLKKMDGQMNEIMKVWLGHGLATVLGLGFRVKVRFRVRVRVHGFQRVIKLRSGSGSGL